MTDTRLLPAEHYRSMGELEDRYWWHQTRYRLVARLLADAGAAAGWRLADVGCGTGGFLRHLAAQGWRETCGFDASAEVVTQVREQGVEASLLDVAATGRLPHAPWDVVTALDVLEHVADEAAFLGTAAASLRPGGLAVLTVPAHGHLYSRWDAALGHHRRYSRAHLRRALAGAGLRPLRVTHFFSYVYPLALLRRATGAYDGRGGCEFPPVAAPVDRLLRLLGRAESAVVRRTTLPFGSSLVAVAVRP